MRTVHNFYQSIRVQRIIFAWVVTWVFPSDRHDLQSGGKEKWIKIDASLLFLLRKHHWNTLRHDMIQVPIHGRYMFIVSLYIPLCKVCERMSYEEVFFQPNKMQLEPAWYIILGGCVIPIRFMTSNWSYLEFSHHILQQYLLCLNISCYYLVSNIRNVQNFVIV